MNYLSLADIMALRYWLTQGNLNSVAVREMASLTAAVESPQRVVFGQEIFGSLVEKAAALFHDLIEFHPFWDGNKRIASGALRLFLQRNGARLTVDDEALRSYAREIARGALSREDVTAWLEQWVSEDHT